MGWLSHLSYFLFQSEILEGLVATKGLVKRLSCMDVRIFPKLFVQTSFIRFMFLPKRRWLFLVASWLSQGRIFTEHKKFRHIFRWGALDVLSETARQSSPVLIVCPSWSRPTLRQSQATWHLNFFCFSQFFQPFQGTLKVFMFYFHAKIPNELLLWLLVALSFRRTEDFEYICHHASLRVFKVISRTSTSRPDPAKPLLWDMAAAEILIQPSFYLPFLVDSEHRWGHLKCPN